MIHFDAVVARLRRTRPTTRFRRVTAARRSGRSQEPAVRCLALWCTLAISLGAGAASGAPRLEKPELKIGFIKLTDCAPLVVAYEKGFFEDEGLYVTLEAQANWKIVLDRVIDGSLDAAHMLPGQVIGANAGIGAKAELVAVAAMGLNTLAITVSNPVWQAMQPGLPTQAGRVVHPIGAASLKPIIASYTNAGRRFTMGMVFPTSTHNYALRYWLAAGGIHPGFYTPTDSNGATGGTVQLSVTPPPQMPATLGAGTIFGFSVGEPWNQQAVLKGLGTTVVTADQIWSRVPEKVLGLRGDFVARNPHTVQALVRAIIRAEQWLDANNGANRKELAKLLARPEYVGADYNVLLGPLTGQYQFAKGDVRPAPDTNRYFRDFAGYPFPGDAVWYLTQMRRWGQIGTKQPDTWYDAIARKAYRGDIYRAAAATLIASGKLAAADVPALEAFGAPAGKFIDGVSFDPGHPNAYLEKFAIGQQSGTSAKPTNDKAPARKVATP